MAGEHAGHRQRMRERFITQGLAGFADHEVLELMLFYAIPQRNVNPLAHQLINHFGSLDAVLSASEEELRSVPGVGPKTSALLHAFNDLCVYYDKNRYTGYRTIVDAPSAVYRARTAFPSNITNELIVLFENNNGSLLSTRSFPGRPADPDVVREILTAALSIHTHSVIIVAKNFCALRRPSKTYIKEVATLVHALSMVEIYTIDYLMLSGDHILSFRQVGLIRDEKNSMRESLPRWHYWYAPLLNYPSTAEWYCVPKEELEKLKKF